MKIALASDHAGFGHKQRLKQVLKTWGHDVVDFGTDSTRPVDYPDFIRPAAIAVANGDCRQGIVLGGSGNGEAIVANRVAGIRCAVCWSVETAQLARQHNDANVISIGQRLTDWNTTEAIACSWLESTFEGGRHTTRIGKIEESSVQDAARFDAMPVLAVSSIQQTANWYGNVLGFRRQRFLHASSGAILARAEARIVLQYQACFKCGSKHESCVHFRVPDVKALFETVKCRADVTLDLRARGRGDAFFEITDFNGYRLLFAGAIKQRT